MTTLMYERKSGGGRSHAEQIDRLRGARERSCAWTGGLAWDDPLDPPALRPALDRRDLSPLHAASQHHAPAAGRAAGPEGSILKLFGSELGVRVADFAGELLGLHVLVNAASDAVPDGPRWYNRVISARQYTIAGGTSEIQRNIIGERVLGLPKD
jgi:alkylation response protein AidB-like acyl-CoA dehydrogenase